MLNTHWLIIRVNGIHSPQFSDLSPRHLSFFLQLTNHRNEATIIISLSSPLYCRYFATVTHNTRYFTIDIQLPRCIMKLYKQRIRTPNVFHTLLPFFATQIVNPFLNIRLSANHDKVQGNQPMVKSLRRGLFLYY